MVLGDCSAEQLKLVFLQIQDCVDTFQRLKEKIAYRSSILT